MDTTKIYYQVGNGAKRHDHAGCSGRRTSISREIPADQVASFAPCSRCLPDEVQAPTTAPEPKPAPAAAKPEPTKIVWFKYKDRLWVGDSGADQEWEIHQQGSGKNAQFRLFYTDGSVTEFHPSLKAAKAAADAYRNA